jgi:hypothetical protein
MCVDLQTSKGVCHRRKGAEASGRRVGGFVCGHTEVRMTSRTMTSAHKSRRRVVWIHRPRPRLYVFTSYRYSGLYSRFFAASYRCGIAIGQIIISIPHPHHSHHQF